jgi:hypothetical protein
MDPFTFLFIYRGAGKEVYDSQNYRKVEEGSAKEAQRKRVEIDEGGRTARR